MIAALTFPFRAARFVLWFAWQVVLSSFTVLADVLTPGLSTRPRVVRMPLDSRSDVHVTAIGALITLTPGTLTLGVVDNDGARALLVHSMYHTDAESAVDDLRDMERRMLLALRIGGTP